MRTRVTIPAFVLLGLAVATVASAPAQPPQPPGQPQPRPPAELAAVPTDSSMFFTVKVSKLWDNPNFKPLREWIASQKPVGLDGVFGLPPADIDRLTVFVPTLDLAGVVQPLFLVTTRQQYNEAKVLKSLGADDAGQPRVRRGRGRVAEITEEGKFIRWVVFADERTILFAPKDALEGAGGANLVAQLIAPKNDGPLAVALADANKHDLAFGVDVSGLGVLLREERLVNNKEFAPYLALLKTRTVTFAADFDKTARGYLKLSFANADDARRAAPVLKEGIGEIAGVFGKELAERKDRLYPAERLFFESALIILKAAKVESQGANVFATAEVPYQDAVTKLAAVLPKSLEVATSNAKAQNNLKQIGLAMHNFNDTMAHFPGDVFGGGQNPPAWSWRVQILPYIEQDNLYRQLDMQKAWDAPENLKALEAMTMPKVFEIPGRPAPKGHTYFRIFTLPKNAKGKERPWLVEGQKGPTVGTVSDGFSNTFLVVEAGEAVPWYKPDILAYDAQLPLPQLGDKAADQFLVLIADGSVRSLKRSKLDEKTLRALITPSGGEPVGLPDDRK